MESSAGANAQSVPLVDRSDDGSQGFRGGLYMLTNKQSRTVVDTCMDSVRIVWLWQWLTMVVQGGPTLELALNAAVTPKRTTKISGTSYGLSSGAKIVVKRTYCRISSIAHF